MVGEEFIGSGNSGNAILGRAMVILPDEGDRSSNAMMYRGFRLLKPKLWFATFGAARHKSVP